MQLSEYEWPRPHGFTPFDHQKKTCEFLIGNRKAFCFNEQGTGKTASVIWATDYLMSVGVIRRVLIVCPLSIMTSAWQADLFKFALHRSVSVAYGSARKRKEIIAAGSEYVVVNFDGVQILKNEIINGKFDLVVIDEASAYKNAQTDRWRTMRDICRQVKGLWMLTGTPAAQSPTDAYGLAKLVNPDGVPKFFGMFRDQVMFPVTQYRWTPRAGAKEIVHKVLQPAIRFEKADCLDLPPVTHIDRESPLSAQQKKFYDTLVKQMLVEADGEEVTAINAAAKVNKLLQISGGAVYTSTKEVIEFDVKNRLNAVLEVIEESSHKVLVFVPFSHTIQLLEDFLRKQGIATERIDGSIPVHKRGDTVKRFQESENPRVLIIQPQAAAHGLTLTAANTIVWYAPVTSVETYLQANARIDRPGQKNNMTVIHIMGSPVERKLYSLLRGNIRHHSEIINLYKQILVDPY